MDLRILMKFIFNRVTSLNEIDKERERDGVGGYFLAMEFIQPTRTNKSSKEVR